MIGGEVLDGVVCGPIGWDGLVPDRGLERDVLVLALTAMVIIKFETRLPSKRNLCQGVYLHQKWSGIWIRISGLIRMRIQMSAGALQCRRFITLSASVISPSVVKI